MVIRRKEKQCNGPGKEVAQVDELAVPLILNVDDAPAVLAATDGLAVDDHRALRANNSEGDHVLARGEHEVEGSNCSYVP